MIHREDRDGIAVLRIEHGKANTLDMESCNAVVEAFDHAGDARAVVLTGAGRIFSAGVDLFRVLEGGERYIEAFVPAMCRAFERVFVHPAPVVAAANGHAIAGGCLLVAAADQRLMAQGAARIGIPELQVGVPFPPIALEIMRSATPPQHFRTIVYRAGTHEPAAALALGLIDEVVEPEALLDRALATAERLASVPADNLRDHQARDPPPGHGQDPVSGADHRAGGAGAMAGATDPGPHPRLSRPDDPERPLNPARRSNCGGNGASPEPPVTFPAR